MTETVLHKTIYLRANPEVVWDYLTDPAKLRTWFHAPKSPLETGAYQMFGTESGDVLMWGDVTVCEPHERLEYTFTVKPMGDNVSTVKWALVAVPGGTQLSLTHTGLLQGDDGFGSILAFDKGWDGHLMDLRGQLHGD